MSPPSITASSCGPNATQQPHDATCKRFWLKPSDANWTACWNNACQEPKLGNTSCLDTKSNTSLADVGLPPNCIYSGYYTEHTYYQFDNAFTIPSGSFYCKNGKLSKSVQCVNPPSELGDQCCHFDPDCTCLFPDEQLYYPPHCCSTQPTDWIGDKTSTPNSYHRKISVATPIVNAWLLVSIFGIIVAMLTHFGRRYPTWKYFPTDDSFRLSVVIKIALMTIKAMCVTKEASEIITISYLTSLAFTAIATLAFQVRTAWENTNHLQRVHHPRALIVAYAGNYLAAKGAAIYFLLV